MRKNKPVFGVACLSQDRDGNIVGDRYKLERSDLRERKYIHGMKGEHWGMMITEVVRKYPFPEIEGFIPEGYVWMEMAKDYDELCVNEPLRIYYDNEPDALSKVRRSYGWWLYHLAVARRDWRYIGHAPLRIIYSLVIAFIFTCSSRIRRKSSGSLPRV